MDHRGRSVRPVRSSVSDVANRMQVEVNEDIQSISREIVTSTAEKLEFDAVERVVAGVAVGRQRRAEINKGERRIEGVLPRGSRLG